MVIPKILHQVWEGVAEPIVPTRLKILSETWKKHNPEWNYLLWNAEKMNFFIKEHFPYYWETYSNFKYAVQRWDAIRYMLLYVYGGIYVDLDTECFKNIESIFTSNKNIYIGLEPYDHILYGYPNPLIGNAFLASTPKQEFWLNILDTINENNIKYKCISRKGDYVLRTTGPLMISEVVEKYKDDIHLLPPNLVAPVSKSELIDYSGNRSNNFNEKISKAYCAHYFFGSWESKFSIYKTFDYDRNGI